MNHSQDPTRAGDLQSPIAASILVALKVAMVREPGDRGPYRPSLTASMLWWEGALCRLTVTPTSILVSAHPIIHSQVGPRTRSAQKKVIYKRCLSAFSVNSRAPSSFDTLLEVAAVIFPQYLLCLQCLLVFCSFQSASVHVMLLGRATRAGREFVC